MDTLAQLTTALAGRYVVEREIGAGGMATVYLARDLRHDRHVALKVLKPELGAVLGVDRFLAEIKVTANLQHPNLLPLFDSGEANGLLFYVMPYVEGESLRQRLEREKQLPIDEALHIATSIAGALDYAHRQGVIHRDLKPENILLRERQPLVADFGIALAVTNAGGARVTQTGLSLGTPQYMSPEQATGDRAIDGRTDLYSLGAVLYEMLTGDPPHIGSTAQAIVAKVLTEKARPVSIARASTPRSVSDAIERVLEKVPADRFATARDFAEALRDRGPSTHSAPAAVPTGSGVRASRRSPAFVAVSALAVAATALALWGWRRRATAAESATPARFVVTLPSDISVDNVFSPLTISRDGRTIIVRAMMASGVRLVSRRIDQLDVRPLPGTDAGGWPVVSPDNKWVAFRSGEQFRKTPLDGGPSVPIAPADGNGGGSDWTPGDTLVIGSGLHVRGLSIVPASGGTLKTITTPDTLAGESSHGWPRVLADGKTVVFVSFPKEGLSGARLAVTTLTGDKPRMLDVNGTAPLGVVDGHLLYVTGDGVLMAVPFDIAGRKTTGAPVALVEGINVNRFVGAARVALADNGTLVYLSSGAASHLVVSDLAGAAQPLLPQSAVFSSPAWSPDGRKIAVTITGAQGSDVWLYDVASKGLSRLTSDGVSATPTWTADGKRLVFTSAHGGQNAVWWQPADAGGVAEKLFDTPNRIGAEEALLTPDNRTLIFRSSPENVLHSVDLQGDRTPKLIASQRGVKVHPALSPDGKWLAYTTDEGISREVVVRPFPGPGPVTQISADGGTEPVWAPDGKRIYYRTARQLVAVDLTVGATLQLGQRRALFEGAFYSPGLVGHQSYSISPDGKHFVLLRLVEDGSRLIVTTNWFTELRERLARKP